MKLDSSQWEATGPMTWDEMAALHPEMEPLAQALSPEAREGNFEIAPGGYLRRAR